MIYFLNFKIIYFNFYLLIKNLKILSLLHSLSLHSILVKAYHHLLLIAHRLSFVTATRHTPSAGNRPQSVSHHLQPIARFLAFISRHSLLVVSHLLSATLLPTVLLYATRAICQVTPTQRIR